MTDTELALTRASTAPGWTRLGPRRAHPSRLLRRTLAGRGAGQDHADGTRSTARRTTRPDRVAHPRHGSPSDAATRPGDMPFRICPTLYPTTTTLTVKAKG